MIVNEAYDFVVTNQGLRYYAKSPEQIIFVLIFAVVLGFAINGFVRLKPETQRRAKLIGLALISLAMTWFAASFGWTLIVTASMWLSFDELHMKVMPVVAVLAMAGLSLLFWFEFFQVLRHRETKFL